jgi:uncharacterized protein YbjT (DUF2867 family)
MSEVIVVTGATGTIGRELLPRLSAVGAQIRALVRDPSGARFDPAVEVVTADLASPDSLRDAFTGATKAFVLANGPDLGDLEVNAFQAAAHAGVGHIVKLSALEAFQRHMADTVHGQAHRRSERHLEELGVSWTMLRPGFFASNMLNTFLRPTPTGGAYFLPTGQGREAPIDPGDIAAAAVHVLTTDGHEGQVYELTGPQLLTVADMGRLMTAATGVPIEHVDLTEAEARTRFLAEGFPPPFADFVLAHTAAVKSGAMVLTDGIPTLLGRAATTFADYAHSIGPATRDLVAGRSA